MVISAKEMIIYSRYIICNNTVSPIGFGQEGTNEMICLVPKTCKLYSFRTEKLEEKLEFAVCNLKNEWTSKSKSISLSIEAVQYVKFIDEYLVVTIKIISSTQKLITVDGQTTIVNMSKEFFRVQYKYYHQNVTNSDNCANTDFDLSAKINQSVFGKCLNNSQQSIRRVLIVLIMYYEL